MTLVLLSLGVINCRVLLLFFSSYREKAKKDAAAVGNHVAKLLQSVGQVSGEHTASAQYFSPQHEAQPGREGLEREGGALASYFFGRSASLSLMSTPVSGEQLCLKCFPSSWLCAMPLLSVCVCVLCDTLQFSVPFG